MKGMKALGRYGSVGFELLASMGVGYYGGRWLDGHFGTTYLKWIGFVVGVYTGFKALFRLSKQMQKDIEQQEALDRGEDPWGEEYLDDDEPARDAKDDGDAKREDDAKDDGDVKVAGDKDKEKSA